MSVRSSNVSFARSIRQAMVTATVVVACVTSATMAQPQSITVPTAIRDFRASNTAGGHPDFQRTGALTVGMVAATLAPDRVPTFIGAPGFGSVTNADTFDQWYRDVDGVNLRIPDTSLTLDRQPNGNYRYNSNAFFPIDGLGFGNQGNSHNYHFTMSIAASFQYDATATQVLTYAGDDDLWAFINGVLVIDLGGIHTTASRTINVQSLAATLGLVDQQTYSLDIFFAERRLVDSTILIETSFPIPSPATLGLLGIGSLYLARRRR